MTLGEVTERALVWVMRQAGCYLPGASRRHRGSQVINRTDLIPPVCSPDFRAVREDHGFFEICRTLLARVRLSTFQPIRRYIGSVDVSITFSVGYPCRSASGAYGGDREPRPMISGPPEDIDTKLYRAITGASWNLFTYMIKSGGSETFQKAEGWL